MNAADHTINSTTSGGIEQGISDTGTGDTLYLNPGTYNKTNQDSNITINKNITIQGNGPTDQIIIDAQKESNIFTIGDGFKVTFINITFINGYNNDGGAIYNGRSQITFINCIFTNNTATGGGGAITSLYGSITIVNSSFIGNSANIGGAIHHRGDNSTITNSTFISNNAGEGGAIRTFNSNLGVFNSTFIDNHGSAGGGAIKNDNGNNVLISNSLFINNTALGQGGAIGNNNGNNFTIIDSVFNNNTGSEGGAIRNNIARINIINSKFFNNTAKNYGGGLYNTGNGTMNLSGNIMSNNVANISGNQIYNQDGSVGAFNLTYLNNSTIIGNNNTKVLLYAYLTDDMGNPISGGNISFYVNNVFIGDVDVNEGYARLSYNVTHGGVVSGNYSGNGLFNNNILNGRLSFVSITNVTDDVFFDKNKYLVNETANGHIIVKNNGPNKALNSKVRIKLPSNFIFKRVSVSHGFYDPQTGIWYVGDLDPNEEVAMNFTGKFTKKGQYYITIETTGDNFNSSIERSSISITENNSHNNSTNNSVSHASMKPTGVNLAPMLLVLLSSLCLIARRKQ